MVGGQPSMVGGQLSMIVERSSMVGRQPSMVGRQPSTIGGQPRLGREGFVGCWWMPGATPGSVCPGWRGDAPGVSCQEGFPRRANMFCL
jgi:hypothetical protein